MSTFHSYAQSFIKNELTESSEAITTLRSMVDFFFSELEAHSNREEGALFPMMGKYIGTQVGPIAVMEYEHEQAKSNLTKFLSLTENVSTIISKTEIQEIARIAVEAYNILDSHFVKEEQVLFPMAERILNAEEKKELLEKMK